MAQSLHVHICKTHGNAVITDSVSIMHCDNEQIALIVQGYKLETTFTSTYCSIQEHCNVLKIPTAILRILIKTHVWLKYTVLNLYMTWYNISVITQLQHIITI